MLQIGRNGGYISESGTGFAFVPMDDILRGRDSFLSGEPTAVGRFIGRDAAVWQ
jgi:hypothetical protein